MSLEEPRKWCTGSQGHSFWEEVTSSLIQRCAWMERNADQNSPTGLSTMSSLVIWINLAWQDQKQMEGGSEERGTSRYEDRVTANCSRHDQQGEPIHRWRLEGNGMPKKVLGFSGGITARVHVAWECSCGRGAGGGHRRGWSVQNKTFALWGRKTCAQGD